MATVDINDIEDLEDGEIESDSEQLEASSDPPLAPPPEELPSKKHKISTTDETKREKKKSKDHHHRSEKDKDKFKKERQVFSAPGPVEDDFAGHIEKAIFSALTKGHPEENNKSRDDNEENNEERKKKHKKRKKHEQSERESSKKRKKMEEEGGDDEMYEDEMMFVRGASPVFRQKEKQDGSFGNYHNGEESDTYASDGSDELAHGPLRGDRDQGRGRPGGGVRDRRHDRPKVRHEFRRNDPHSIENETICPYYMQGNCYKGNDCPYSHDAQLPRKMELCKFYLMECCAKRDKCLYLHSDFPCKYYHTGLYCELKDNCKFAHGKPLSDNLVMILLKHIETAPKEILGDFPRLTRENASAMVNETQNRLRLQYKMDLPDSPERNVYKEKPLPIDMVFHSDKKTGRQSRWCDSANDVNMPNSDTMAAHLNAQNLNGVLSPKQISDLAKLGIENLNQISQLTVMQLNQLGLTMNQINEIQLNTMNVQKRGIVGDQSSKSYLNNIKANKDLDMRVSPALPELPVRPVISETTGKDIDMRYLQASVPLGIVSDKDNKGDDLHVLSDPRKNKNSIDIDQYTKDALKFSNIDRSNSSDISSINYKEERGKHSKKESEMPQDLDVDHRLLKYVRDATVVNVKLVKDDYSEHSDCDTDIRLSNLPAKQQEMFMRTQKKNEIKDRRPTTDDDEDNLQIDEKWYSSDEDHSEKVINKIKSPPQVFQPVLSTPSTFPPALEPGSVITKLGDLSKIDISAEVTKFLTSIKSSLPVESSDPQTKKEQLKSRDPRSHAKKSPEHRSETAKKVTKSEAVSIYDCVEGGNRDSRRRTDVDLRPTKDADYRIPSFGDTDLRLLPSGGDVDLRLGLPFKPLPNYTPATEIDGSISSHLPITYKVHIVDIPRPDYTDIRNTTVATQASIDPRLRKIFRLSLDDNPLEVETFSKSTAVRIDPRKRAKESTEVTILKPATLDIQSVIQTSSWYKDLSSNQKILVNQQLATVTSSLKKFSQDQTPGKIFDLSEIQRNDVLSTIFTNLGVTLDEKGEFSHVKIQENVSSNMAMPPINFNQNPNEVFGGMVGLMDINMMGMNPMNGGNMNNINNMNNMPPMNPFGFPAGDPRGAPGLLGIAPHIPHNFDNSNFNGISNFNSDNNFSNNYDNGNVFNPLGKMNEFNADNNNYDDNNTFYNRNNKKNDYKSYRGGRGGDRWNRGNSRGGRDRRGFTDRGGSWKNDRR